MRRAAIDVCWRQWSALKGAGAAIEDERPQAIIDPEALVLLSLSVQHHERRLTDALDWLARVGSTLLSVQRMQTLLRDFPASIRQDAAQFAAHCSAAGDRRFRSLVDQVSDLHATWSTRASKEPSELRLLTSPTLMLRLRAGFGVGVKADLLSFLIGLAGARTHAWASAEEIAAAISYSAASVRRATADMVLARFVRATRDRPAKFGIEPDAWTELVTAPAGHRAGGTLPRWRFCSQMFALLARSLDWTTETRDAPPIVRASRARDVADDYIAPLRWNGIRTPDPDAHPGELYLDGFHELMASVTAWVDAEI